MYTSDYDDFMPFAMASIDPASRTQGYFARNYYKGTTDYYPIWADQIMPYVNNEQIFRCPSKPNDWIGYGYNVYCGYVCGFYAIDPSRTGPLYEGVNTSDINRPAEHAWIIDHQDGYWPSYGGQYPTWAWYRAWGSLTNPDISGWDPPHNEGANVGCVDGHAKWMKQTQFMWTRYGGRLNWHYDDP